MQISRVPTARCEGGEGPLWEPAEQALYFIDISGRMIHRYDPAAGDTRSWPMPSVITSLALRSRGGAVVTLRTGVHTVDFDTGALQCLSPLSEPPPIVYNDAKVDRRGRLLFGACTANHKHPTPDGGLFRLDADHSIHTLDTGVHFSNGPCFSPDDRTFYFSDSYLNTCYAYDYDIATGRVANKRTFVNTSEFGGLPDGATVDRDGRVWIAIYGGGRIVAFRSDGRPEQVIEMPVKLVSSVMFGGPQLDRLYVTTIAKSVIGESTEEGAGEVYVIEGLGVQGVPEPRYAG
jgi:sugar lactone lactonase YvrE